MMGLGGVGEMDGMVVVCWVDGMEGSGAGGVGWYSILMFTSSYLDYVFALSIFHFQQQASGNFCQGSACAYQALSAFYKTFLGGLGLFWKTLPT